MFGLMTRTVFLAGEPALLGLRTTLMPTEEMLAVAIEMLTQITPPAKQCL
jgi:hypothetical protein